MKKRTKRNKRKTPGAARLFALLLALLSLLPLGACLNPVSVDNYGYVVAIGADKGKKKRYEITLELQRESSGESQQNNGGAIILSAEADDLFDATNEFAAGIAYNLNFTRTHVFIFGEELARSGGIKDFLSASMDVLRIRRSALMVVAKCPVRDYIGGLAANNTANIAKMQDVLISDVQQTGEIAAVNVSRFFEACAGGRFDPVMPLGFYDEKIITDTKQREEASKGENPIQEADEGQRVGGMQGLTLGCALFDGGKMCGELDAAQTQLMNMVRGDFGRGIMKYAPPEGESASLLVFLTGRRVKVELDGAPRASVRLQLNITIASDPSCSIGKSWNDGGREALISYFTAELQSVFEKCRSVNSDAMGFGRCASKNFCSTDEWEGFDWKAAYRQLSVDFELSVNLDDEYLAKTNG